MSKFEPSQKHSGKLPPKVIHIYIIYQVLLVLGCQQALGMANGAITDEQISASSEHNPTTHSLKFGRLFYTLNSGAWVAKVSDDSQWIQIDLLRNNIKVTRLATQGRANYGQWVTSYKLQQSNDGTNFKYYREAGQPEDKVKFKVVVESIKKSILSHLILTFMTSLLYT